MPSLRTKALAVTATAAAIVSGGAAVANASPHHRATVKVHAGRARQVSAPHSTHPGLAHIRNTGWQPIFLVRPRGHASPATLARDLETPTPAAMERHFTTLDLVPGHSSVYVRLTKGMYYLLATALEPKAASVRTMIVTGSRIDAAAPTSTSITVDSHNKLRAPAALPKRYLHVRNSSANMQELMMFKVNRTATDQALAAAIAHPSLERLFRVSIPVREVAILDRHRTLYASPANTSGRFLLVAMTLRKNQKEPHLVPGQVRLVTLT